MTPQQTPQLNDKQKKQYNTYRATGMNPERALSLALQNGDTKFSPASTEGLDNLFVGKGGLINEVAGGVKDAFTAEGAREQYEKDIADFGQAYADDKKPLTYGSKVGKGVGRAIFSVIETADDLTGEAVSGTLAPVVDDAINSDVGQYLTKAAIDWNEEQGGVPGEILDTLDLFGLTAAPRKASVQSIRNSILQNGKRVVDQGIDSTRRVGRLTDYFRPTAPNNPVARQIDDNFKNLEEILTTKAAPNTDVSGQLADIKAMIRNKNFEESVLPMLDDFDLTPEERDLIGAYIKNIDEAVNQEGATDIVEAYLTGRLDDLDSAAAGATSVIENLSDAAIDRTMKTVENVRNVPAAIAGRVTQANDRRIIRIATTNVDEALKNISELYKKAVVPGVKKKNKTIANINAIDEAVKRVIPELAKKYDIEDLEDFANAISLEKKAIFSQIDEGLQGASKTIDLNPIIAELDKLAKTERATFSTPLRKAIDRARAELVFETPDGDVVVKNISASGAQDLIADINAALQPQFRGARTNADDVVDFLVLNNLRKLTDDVVDDLGQGSFKDLKAQYADLKKLEDDVVHRAVFEAQKGNGLTSNIADVTSAADLAAGAFSPAFLARSAGGFITKEVTKALNDKNELVRQMFLYGRNTDAPVRRGGAPVKPNDDVVEKADDGRFETSLDSEVIKAIPDQDLQAKTDFTKPVAVTESEIDLFGTKLPLNKLESEVLNDPEFKVIVDTSKTKTGRKKAKQPIAFYDLKSGNITFSPRKDFPIERTMQAFYHEIGHKLDYTGKKGTERTIRGDGFMNDTPREVRTALRHSGWKLPTEERNALARERFGRMMSPTQKNYDLTDDQITDMFNLREVRTETGRFPKSQKLVSYIKSENELFAEAYAMFRMNPEKLRELSPRTFEFISEIVNQ